MNNKMMIESRRWQFAFFAAVNILIFTALFHSIYDTQYSATALYYDYASKVMHGSFPYRDFNLEYPPFSLVFFVLPRLFTAVYTTYAIIYQAEVLLFILIGLWLINDISKRIGQAPWKMLTVYTLGILAIGPIIGQQYDIFPAVMTLLSLYFFWLEKHKLAWALLALGIMTKIYPAVIVPIFIIYYVCNRQYTQLRTGIITLTVVSILIILPFLVTSPDSLLQIFNYHAQRGIQLESTYSSFLILAHKLGWVNAYTDFRFGAWNIEGTIEDVLAKLSTVFLVLFLLITYAVFYRRKKSCKVDIMLLGSNLFQVTLIVLITSKILSPQYLIWLIPLLPLIAGKWRLAIWTIFIIAGGLTYYIFPYNYLKLVDFKTAAVAALLFRNLLLILMAVLVGFSMKEHAKSISKTVTRDS